MSWQVTKRDDPDAVKVEALSSVAAEGESIYVKVISVKTEEDGSVKVGCSLKYVSQGDGRDLDPNNLQLEKLQAKPAWQAPKKATSSFLCFHLKRANEFFFEASFTLSIVEE